jgi:hypothetical protein
MVVRYPVDRRRGDVHHALHPVPQGRVEHVTRPLDVRGVDVLGGVEGEGGGGVDDVVSALHRLIHEGLVADVALDHLDAVLLGVVELLHV